MSWADRAKSELREGRSVVVRPRGQSMRGRIESGDLVTLKPVKPEEVEVGDAVLVRVKGRDLLHLVQAKDGDRLLISNNRGVTNGWVGSGSLYGKATKVEKFPSLGTRLKKALEEGIEFARSEKELKVRKVRKKGD